MWDSKGIKLFLCIIWWQELNPNLYRYNDDIPVLPATDFSCCFARELVLTLYIVCDTTKGKWTALLLFFKHNSTYLSKASDWNSRSEHPWCWQNKSIFMPCRQNCHSYLDLHHVHKVPWKICSLCMWGNGSENTDHFQNACFEFQCLLLVQANTELLLVHTKSLTLHVK